MAANIIKFFKRDGLARFGVPHPIVIDNGTKFTDIKLIIMLEELKVKQYFSSIEHSQSNGQEEAANWVLL